MEMPRLEEVISKKQANPGLVYLAYLQAEALALYLGRERGDSWIPSLITRLRNGQTFEEAFQTTIGIPPARAMEQTRKSLE